MCVRKKPTATTIMMKCEAEKRIAAGAVVGAFDECYRGVGCTRV